MAMETTTRTVPFHDRADAGRVLASHPRLQRFRGRDDAIVLALPRGGVPVAYEVAMALGLPLDVFVVRKLGTPGREELAMGAIASGGIRVIEPEVVRSYGLSQEVIDAVAERERRAVEEREGDYRRGRQPIDASGRSVILVDDGLATGSTMRAAVRALRGREPREIVVAVPVAPLATCAAMEAEADEVICAVTPGFFGAVGLAYERFDQTSDAEVVELLDRASERSREPPGSSARTA
jgi:putative phosphoribosyl transferase